MLRFDHTPSWRSVLLIVCSAAVIGFGGAANAADPSSDPASAESAAADANAGQPGARSQAVNAQVPWLFSNEKSGRCIGVDHAGTHHGAYLKQFTCDGKANQYWTPEYVDTNYEYFVLRNMKSQRCMGVNNASTRPGADLRLFDCDYKANQQWKFGSDDANPSSIRNFKSKLCIGVHRASVDNRAQLKQYECVNGAPQQSWLRCPDPEACAP